MAIGSRPGAGSNVACAVRGTRWRAALPAAARSRGWTHGRAVHTSPSGLETCHAASISDASMGPFARFAVAPAGALVVAVLIAAISLLARSVADVRRALRRGRRPRDEAP